MEDSTIRKFIAMNGAISFVSKLDVPGTCTALKPLPALGPRHEGVRTLLQ